MVVRLLLLVDMGECLFLMRDSGMQIISLGGTMCSCICVVRSALYLRVYNTNMLHNPLTNHPCLILCVLTALLVQVHPNYILMSVSSNNLQINQLGNYTFTINRQYDPVNFAVISNPLAVPLNSTISITYPPQFLTISNSSSSLPCTDSNGNELGCTLNAATRKVTIANYYASTATLSNTLITIIMPNIINAYKAGDSDNFFWEIRYPNGSVIDQGPATTTNYVSTALTFLPGTFKCTPIFIQLVPFRPAEHTSGVLLP